MKNRKYISRSSIIHPVFSVFSPPPPPIHLEMLSSRDWPQVLGGDQYRLHALPHQPPGVHDDLPGVVRLGHCVTGAAVRLEGSGLPTTNRAAKVYGFAGHRIPGRFASYLNRAVIILSSCFNHSEGTDRILFKHPLLFLAPLQIFATCCTFYVPLLVILVLYWKIYQTARRRIHRRRPKPPVTGNNNQVSGNSALEN